MLRRQAARSDLHDCAVADAGRRNLGGTDDGLIQLTRDEGKTWENVTPPELTPWSKVTHIEASHSDAGKAYAAVDRHRLEDLQAVFVPDEGFREDLAARFEWDSGRKFFELRAGRSESRKGLLYACTEKGVYVSFDDGDNWQPLQFNLPMTSVRDLVVHGDDLVIATFGRSFWVLDDVTPLRQMELRRWQPRTRGCSGRRQRIECGRVRIRARLFRLDEPQAENPPNGAVVDYYLKGKADGGRATGDFRREGKLVRRFASTEFPRRIKNLQLYGLRRLLPLSSSPPPPQLAGSPL